MIITNLRKITKEDDIKSHTAIAKKLQQTYIKYLFV